MLSENSLNFSIYGLGRFLIVFVVSRKIEYQPIHVGTTKQFVDTGVVKDGLTLFQLDSRRTQYRSRPIAKVGNPLGSFREWAKSLERVQIGCSDFGS